MKAEGVHPYPKPGLLKRSAAEAVGTGMLLATIVGSGIMAERLAGDEVAVALLANCLATGGVLTALILAFGPISGAHLNPVVTLSSAGLGRLPWNEAPCYLGAQMTGAFAGVGYANLMFDMPLYFPASRARNGLGVDLGEVIATFGLVIVIWACARYRAITVGPAVGAYIAGAHWFASSTSFANPAVTLARTMTDTFSGIRLLDTPAFILAQCLGAAAATVLFKWLAPDPSVRTQSVLSPNVLEAEGGD